MKTAPRVGTIGDLLHERRALYLCCENHRCVRSAAVDLTALAGKEGTDLPLQRLIERAVCRACGSRWPLVTLIAPPESVGGYPRCSDPASPSF